MSLVFDDIDNLRYLWLPKVASTGYDDGPVTFTSMFRRDSFTDSDGAYVTVSSAAAPSDDSARINVLAAGTIRSLVRQGSNVFDQCDPFLFDEFNGTALRCSGDTGWTPYCALNGAVGTGGGDERSVVNLSNTVIGGVYTNSINNSFTGYLAEIGIWDVELEDWELSVLTNGVRPSSIRPAHLWAYVPLIDDITDLGNNGNVWRVYDNETLISIDDLSFSQHPNMVDAIEVRYPIQQSGFDANSLDTTISDYRATRLVSNIGYSQAESLEWQLWITGGDKFSFFTNSIGTELTGSANVLASSASTLDLWLPPGQEYNIRLRQLINNTWSSWTGTHQFTALGYINSYDKYQILNRRTITSY